ncbi:ErfK/YbiS/YcfS/YnhG family protein [Mycobacterium haemophilum]|uniref:ErfK/YbiS/YcfS/YnhG family protein n=1 Tax=Mycobacterium haemophilum TaxID=29311 RepID=A0A0I9U5Q0_9MYCO|nr:ErfK/YbiS/YcfS/YnhG family protein [Mycobacterium haemophilum]KLO37531.1 ErfK/YbiS/YcfS/YnhG family protein [Mycobacterium haemophilum]KLO44080.1 ErfK/YbiS/YcfS/YnhG family protein [Mycobacterium haemophilum]KLO49346.1 ErfK/YbiS/YcfS/YnhG family protein [Mycobacterium haemophilum]
MGSATRGARPKAWRALLALLVIPVVVPAVACGRSGGTAPVNVIGDKGTPFADLLVPKLTASVTDGAVGVTVDAPVTVTVADGVLAAVTMVNDNGRTITGQLSPDGLRWSTTEPLGFNRRYTLSAKALGLGGAANRQMTFQTSSPAHLTMPYVNPGDGEVVGIGEPVAIRFDENIANRAAAQKAITITANPPVEGAFYWLNNREVRWRPEHFWKSGTAVDVAVNTYGVDLGDGMFGEDNVKTHFTIGDEVVATADDTTKMLTVRVNGEVVKTMPTSMGKDSTPTANGIYIVGARYKHIIMDSSTYGVPVNSPNGYRTNVDWATQLSYSGVYVHSAPWSVGAQGHTNTSHGCLNVSPSNAQWFYDHVKRGDIVEIVNTVGGTLPGAEGLGDWNIPWAQWKAGNANTPAR